MNIQPVIMSGGAGTRLWPLSRQATPKQFRRLVTNHTMFQETVLRVSPDTDERLASPLVITGAAHRDLVVEQLKELSVSPEAVILEPTPRNTAAVAAVAAAYVDEKSSDDLILLMPADHHIEHAEKFRQSVADGASAARDGHIVTFGIDAKTPHTGYGYIQADQMISNNVHSVATFKEKPDPETAQQYVDDGRYFWNAGIFLFSARAMLAEFKAHNEDISRYAKDALRDGHRNGAVIALDPDIFAKCPADSIDYAIMEKTAKAAVVGPVDAGWTDIGSWSELAPRANDNAIMEIDSVQNIIRTDGPVIGAIGVENLIIVATGDAVLVARKDRAQDVKALITELKKRGREDLL